MTSACSAASAGVMTCKPSASAFSRLLLPVGQTDHNIAAVVMHIQGMSMSLASIADHGNPFSLDKFEIRICVIIDICHRCSSPLMNGYMHSQDDRKSRLTLLRRHVSLPRNQCVRFREYQNVVTAQRAVSTFSSLPVTSNVTVLRVYIHGMCSEEMTDFDNFVSRFASYCSL